VIVMIPDERAMFTLDALNLITAVEQDNREEANRIVRMHWMDLPYLLEYVTSIAAYLLEHTTEGRSILDQLRDAQLEDRTP
jgi:hypothetical protein